MRSKSSNDGCRRELGSFPILYYVLLNLVKYWCHMVKTVSQTNSILSEALKLSEDMASSCNDSWCGCIKDIFKYLKLEHLYERQESFKTNFIINRSPNLLISGKLIYLMIIRKDQIVAINEEHIEHLNIIFLLKLI